MPRVFIHRELIKRIERVGLGTELRSFVKSMVEGQHPPRVYKASGINPSFRPYEELELHHHHLHRDGDPLLVTQHVDGAVYGIALATHETFFREDNMQCLKDHAEAIDWTAASHLYQEVMEYGLNDQAGYSPSHDEDSEDDGTPSDDIPF
jgi:hypothetical protein